MDVDIAFAVLLECLKWRNSFGVRNIGLLELKPLLDRRLAYVHGKDLKGRSILWLNMSQHKTGDRAVEKLLVYWLERHTTERHAAPLTVLFDMTASGLQNMDLDFMKFLLRAFKYYYPCCLASLLVFDNPAVLNASWKLVRSWMDTDIQHLFQHVTRATIADLVPSQYLPIHMGGEDEFIFTMDELARCIPSQSSSEVPMEQNAMTPDLDNFITKRQAVKFDEDDAATRATPLNVHARSASLTKRNGAVPATLKPLAEARISSASTDSISTSFLSICPREELTLNRVDGENDSVDIVVLKNISMKNVIYKIKITSPEKFRVRPSTGVVAAGATELIRVYLQNEYKHSVNREKFLLMALETDAKTSEDFSSAWKNADDNCKVEHKLRCRLADNNDPGLPPVHTPIANHVRNNAIIEHQEPLQRQIADLAHKQRVLFICIIVLIILQLISLGCQRSYHVSLLTAQKEHCFRMEPTVNEPIDSDPEL